MGCLYTGSVFRAFFCWCLRHCSHFLPCLPHLCRDQCYLHLSSHATHHLGGFLSPFIHLIPHFQAYFSCCCFPSVCPPPWKVSSQAGQSSSADPTVCAPWPSPGEAQGRSWMQAACKCCLVYESCLLVQTAVWGELGKFVWHEALKLTKDCRAWAGIDKTRGAGKGRSEPFLSSPCSLNIPAAADGCSGHGENNPASILRGSCFIY